MIPPLPLVSERRLILNKAVANCSRDRPLQSTLLSCLIAGAVLVLLGRLGIRVFGPVFQSSEDSEVPLAELPNTSSSSSSSSRPTQEYFSVRARGYRILLTLTRSRAIGLLLLIRVALLRHITLSNQCVRSETDVRLNRCRRQDDDLADYPISMRFLS